MAKTTKTYRWRVYLIVSTPARFLGSFETTTDDEATVYKLAAEHFDVEEPLRYKLLAVPVKAS